MITLTLVLFMAASFMSGVLLSPVVRKFVVRLFRL